MLNTCETSAIKLYVKFNFNTNKSTRIGSRFDSKCAEVTLFNSSMKPVEFLKVLCVCMKAGKTLKGFQHIKATCYRISNCTHVGNQLSRCVYVVHLFFCMQLHDRFLLVEVTYRMCK